MITVVDGATPAGQQAYNPHKLSSSSAKGVAGLSISQLVMGSLCIIFEIALVCMSRSERYGFYGYINGFVAPGIWNGAFLLIVGIVGVLAARKNARGLIIAYMVLNIIAAVAMPTFIGLTGTATAETSVCAWYSYYNANRADFCNTKAGLALNVLNLIMAISQFIITIVAACLCCGPACCNSPAMPIQTTMVIHNGQQQQMMVSNQPYGQMTYAQVPPSVQVVQPGMGYSIQQTSAFPQQQPPPTYYGYDQSPQQQQQVPANPQKY